MSDFIKGAENTVQGGGDNQQSSGGGGGGIQGQAEEKMVDQGVDNFAQKEGVPSAADGAINKEVNSEMGKFT